MPSLAKNFDINTPTDFTPKRTVEYQCDYSEKGEVPKQMYEKKITPKVKADLS
jgi:hypothetical protein